MLSNVEHKRVYNKTALKLTIQHPMYVISTYKTALSHCNNWS